MKPIHETYQKIKVSLEENKEQIAIIDKGKSFNYRDLKEGIAFAQKQLQHKKIKKGSMVLIAVPMSFELYAILEAVIALGATAVFLDPWMSGKSMKKVIKQVQPAIIITTPKIARLLWLLPVTWFIPKWKVKELGKSKNEIQFAAVSDEDNALITFTSGTSGNPKGAIRTFSFLKTQSDVLTGHLSGQNHVDLTNFPIAGLVDFEMGNTVVIPEVNLMKIHTDTIDHVMQQIEKNKVTRLIVSPSLLNKILNQLPKNHTVNTVLTGGAPIGIELLKKGEKFPEIEFEAIYGSTEAEPMCLTTFDQMRIYGEEPLKGVFVGVPIDEIELLILPLSTPHKVDRIEELHLKNEVGEVVVSGGHVNQNYYENPEAFRENKIVSQGKVWYRTGDLGRLKKEGLFLHGRKHRIIEKGHEKFYPYPIEQLIAKAFEISDLGYVQKKGWCSGILRIFPKGGQWRSD